MGSYNFYNRIDNLYNTSSNNNNNNKVEPTLESINEDIALNKEDVLHPTSFNKTIMRFQQKDKSLIEIDKEKLKDYSIKKFHGAGKTYSLIYINGKIMIPKQIQKTLIEWYHNILCHPVLNVIHVSF